MLAKGQITVTNLDDGKTPFLHQAYKMKDGRFLKHYPVYEAPPVDGYKEGDLWHWNGEDYPGRNLILGSNKFSRGSGQSPITGSVTPEGYLQVSSPGTGANYFTSFFNPTPNYNLVENAFSEGDTFTLKYDARSENHTKPPTFYIKSGIGYFGMTGVLSTEFSTFYFTGKWKKLNNIVPHIGFSNILGETVFKGIGICKGESTTPYSPAPEDLTGGKQSGYFVANKSNTTFDFNDWTFYADELAYSDTDKFYPKFEGTYSDYNEVASDDQTKYTWKMIQADNVPSITTVSKEYYLSTSNTSTVGGTWSEKIPPWTTGKFYWSRMHTIFVDGTIKTSTSVLDEGLNLSLVTTLEVKATTQTLSTTVSQQAGQIALKANTTDVNTLTGRVNSAEGSITTIAGQVALKANSSDVNTLTGRVTTAEGSITTQAGQIALKANQSVVDTLTGRVSTTEAKITATDGKVTTLTTKTEGNTTSIGLLQTGYDGLSSTVTALETGKVGNDAFSALEQNLNGFKTTVANTYADKTTVNQLAGQWSSTVAKVDGHTGQISNLGEQINLRVTQAQVDASILKGKRPIENRQATNDSPIWYLETYGQQTVYELKDTTALGLGGAGTLETIVSSVTSLNGSAYTGIKQTYYQSNGDVYTRTGEWSTSWSVWARVADTSNILSQINLSTEGVLIQGKKVQITGETYIQNGVIKTAHIADLAVSGAKIANASIASAKIISLDASKITAGTINTSLINIIATSGNKRVQLTGSGLSAIDENGKLRLAIGIQDIAGDGQSDPSNILFYTGNGSRSFSIGTNVNDTLVIGTEASNQFVLMKSTTQVALQSWDIRFAVQGTTNNAYLTVGRATLDNKVHPTLSSHTPATGVLGTNQYYLRKVFSVEYQGDSVNIGYDNAPQVGHLFVGSWSNVGVLQSYSVYNRTASMSANVGIGANGVIMRTTSARKYKTSIVESSSIKENAKKILGIKPVEWLDIAEIKETGKSAIYYGFIADEFYDLGLKEVVMFDSDGQIEGLAYDRISMYHNVILQDHEQQLKRLDSIDSNVIKLVANSSAYGTRLNNLESEVFRLKKRIEELEKIA